MKIKVKIEGEQHENVIDGYSWWEILAGFMDILEDTGFNLSEIKKELIPAKNRSLDIALKRCGDISCSEMES